MSKTYGPGWFEVTCARCGHHEHYDNAAEKDEKYGRWDSGCPKCGYN